MISTGKRRVGNVRPQYTVYTGWAILPIGRYGVRVKAVNA